jgi:hypothetical protein
MCVWRACRLAAEGAGEAPIDEVPRVFLLIPAGVAQANTRM